MANATKNFHLPLTESLYAELRAAAEARGKPTTKLAQEFVKQGLADLRRMERRRQIAAYAAAVAGTADDLDEALETAGVRAVRGAGRP